MGEEWASLKHGRQRGRRGGKRRGSKLMPCGPQNHHPEDRGRCKQLQKRPRSGQPALPLRTKNPEKLSEPVNPASLPAPPCCVMVQLQKPHRVSQNWKQPDFFISRKWVNIHSTATQEETAEQRSSCQSFSEPPGEGGQQQRSLGSCVLPELSR